jgi:hypothetical protein
MSTIDTTSSCVHIRLSAVTRHSLLTVTHTPYTSKLTQCSFTARVSAIASTMFTK